MPLDDDVLAERGEDWTEILIEIVPENFLFEAFSLAAKEADSRFPLGTYEIKSEYKKILAEQFEQKRQNDLKIAMENERDYNSPFWKPCEMCFGCGWAETSRADEFGRDYKGVIKCYSCNYWELYSQKHGLGKI